MSDIQTVLGAFKTALEPFTDVTHVQVYDHQSDSPVIPSVSVTLKTWPYDLTIPATVSLWCVVGTTEAQGAQADLLGWLSDTGPTSLVALIDANNTLSGAVSSVMPVETNNYGMVTLPNGTTRVLQGELVCEVLR